MKTKIKKMKAILTWVTPICLSTILGIWLLFTTDSITAYASSDGEHIECQPHSGYDCLSGSTQVIYIGYWTVTVE